MKWVRELLGWPLYVGGGGNEEADGMGYGEAWRACTKRDRGTTPRGQWRSGVAGELGRARGRRRADERAQPVSEAMKQFELD